MFADLKDMPTIGCNNASAWSCMEQDPFVCGCTNNPSVPNEADVKALLQLLSCRVDEDKLFSTESSALYEQPGSQSRPDSSSGSNEGADERDVGTRDSLCANGSFLDLFHHHDGGDASSSPKVPREEGSLKEGSYGCTPSSTYYRHAGSSSSNTLTGSSTSSRTERPASTTTVASHGAESATRVSTSRPPLHNTAVSNALANIGSGLAEENFNVLTPDKRMMLSIPAAYVHTTLGSRNYRYRNRDKLLFSFCLCKTFCSGATCHHGTDCDFIHCDPEKLRLVQSAAESKGKKADSTVVHSFEVHWSTPVNSLAEATYPCLPSGHVVHVKGGEGAGSNATQALPSEMVYATVGGREALRLPSTATLRICKHYEREKCARGALCPYNQPGILSPTAAAGVLGRGVAPQGSKATAARTATPAALVAPPLPPLSQPPATPPTTCLASAPSVTAAQLHSGALVRHGDTLFMWFPERQVLVPLHATAVAASQPAASSTSASAVPSQSPAIMVNIDYQRGPKGMMGSPASFQMPANAMLVQSSSAVAVYPQYNFYSCSQLPRSQANMNASNGAGPVFPTVFFPC